MINTAPLARFRPLGDGRLVRPIYADYSFGNIPNTIEYLLTGEKHGPLLPADCFGGTYPQPEKIVVIFVDSFGWEFWQAYGKRFRATSRVMEAGTLTPISALFPSTTAASVSTMNLGVLPAAHALYEWNIYIPAYGEVIQSLAFTPLGRHPPDACRAKGYDPGEAARGARDRAPAARPPRRALDPVRPPQLCGLGLQHGCQRRRQDRPPQHAGRGAGAAEGGACSPPPARPCSASTGPRSTRLRMCTGPAPATTPPRSRASGAPSTRSSPMLRAPTRSTSSPPTTATSMRTHAPRSTSTSASRRSPTACRVSPTGNPIYPNGSPRDMFLHVRPERVAEVLGLLHRELDDVALILPMEQVLAEGLFGPGPDQPGAAAPARAIS